ncbi:putative leucine-rich repeat domain superfamily, F-box-like domain superfamily [Helianthus annuus]|nr:putative leucine-rich repeat domain superfamily, F-box-like domain superfamily [Helianthus annuus]
MTSKRMSKGERSSLDIISTLPEPILETILCLLPTKAATRTSILSREWRYKWTKISKLEFFVPMRKTIEKQVLDRRCTPFNDLLQVLLSHKGLIHEFSLLMNQLTPHQDFFGFDQVVLHLLKNHAVKKLKLYGLNSFRWHKLPMSIFSLHHLTDLNLSCFVLDHEPIFNGLGDLRSLSLSNVGISTKTLLHLLSNSPSLKSLTLVSSHLNNIVFNFCSVSEYSKLLQFIGKSHLGCKDCTVIELFKCLPMIERLTTFGYVFEWLVLKSVPQRLPTLLFHLKYFCFENMWFADGHGLAFLLVLIKCSPNLEKIKLEVISIIIDLYLISCLF